MCVILLAIYKIDDSFSVGNLSLLFLIFCNRTTVYVPLNYSVKSVLYWIHVSRLPFITKLIMVRGSSSVIDNGCECEVLNLQGIITYSAHNKLRIHCEFWLWERVHSLYILVLPLPTYPPQTKWSSCSSSCYIILKSVKKWGNEAGVINCGFPGAATKASTFTSIKLLYTVTKAGKMLVSRLKN